MEILAQHGNALIILAVIFGAYTCWGIGANDVANAMGPPVGSKSITIKQALLYAAVFEFLGAFIAGGSVTATIRKGIIDPAPYAANPELLVYGMLGALLATAIWLMLATMKGWPVSTTHSIVGAIVGVGISSQGMDGVKWDKMTEIVASWVVSPVVGGVIAYILTMSIRKLILDTERPFEQAKKWGPFYIFLVGFIICLVTLFKGLEHLKLPLTLNQNLVISTVIGIISGIVGKFLIDRVQADPQAEKEFAFASVEKVFTPMMIFTACAMCFAHGSNDVANGIGPVAAVVSIIESHGEVSQKSGLPLWILAMGGVMLVIGLATYGHKVIATIGTKITELTPSRAFSATLAAAITVVIASRSGLPVSTSHTAVGAVMGVGLARGIGALDLRVLGGIVASWIATLPIAAIGASLIFFLLKGIFS